MSSKYSFLTDNDRKFLKKAMREFGINKLGIQWSDYSKRRYPDIWVVSNGQYPVIVVTAAWKHQNEAERHKRITHEFLHLVGMEHDNSIGYNTHPEKDSFSKRFYNAVFNPRRRKV